MKNVKFQHAVSDMEGVSAFRVIGATASGKTDPEKPVDPMDPGRFRKDRATTVKSLKGDYRQGLVNVPGEKIEEYGFHIRRMRKYGLYMENMLEQINLTEKLKRESEGSREKPSTEKDRGEKKIYPQSPEKRIWL